MMRKFFIAVLGVVSLGIFVQPVFAGTTVAECNKAMDYCYGKSNGKSDMDRCDKLYDACLRDAPFRPGRSDQHPTDPTKPGGGKSGGGSSKPKQVNGQSQRTVDGGTIMVTPEGKEWIWNGKYNTIATYERNGVIGEYHSVMQGDPDARWRKVNGKDMQESDPRYIAEAEAAVKKQGPVTVRDHRTPQPAPTPPAAGAATNGGTATQGASAGQAPSTTNLGSTATNTGGSYVRDHRQGANGATVPPPVAAAGINKKPGKYAQ